MKTCACVLSSMMRFGPVWLTSGIPNHPKISNYGYGLLLTFAIDTIKALWSRIIRPSSDISSRSRSLTLRHEAYFIHHTSCYHVGILSSHTITMRRVSKFSIMRVWERDHIYITYIILIFIKVLFMYNVLISAVQPRDPVIHIYV